MNTEIKELELTICGYDLAVNCDHVPEYKELDIEEYYDDIFDKKYSKELIKQTMEKYEGWSDGDMTNELISRAEDLLKKLKK